MLPIKMVLKKYNRRVLSHLMFYENINTTTFKVMGSLIYCIMVKYLCVYFQCLQKVLPSLVHKVFENTSLNDISGIFIPELLINIMTCHSFVNNMNTTVILTCCIKLVQYYLSKRFLIIENNLYALIYVPKMLIKKLMWKT